MPTVSVSKSLTGSVPHGDHEEVDVDLLVPDHGQDSLVPIRTVGVNLNRLPADQMIEVVTGFLAVGLPGFRTVRDLRDVDAEKPDAELGAVGRHGGDGVGGGDALDGSDNRARRGREGRNGESEASQRAQPRQEAALGGHSTLSPTPPLVPKRIPRTACERKGDRGEGNTVCGAGIKNRLPI